MNYTRNIINSFLKKLKLCNCFPQVHSVILGGTVAKCKNTLSSDIDLLLVARIIQA
ncbi:MAG: hypothetical protein ACTSX6_03380 [Candidatus Heimdallarchaeaceae archaeon]